MGSLRDLAGPRDSRLTDVYVVYTLLGDDALRSVSAGHLQPRRGRARRPSARSGAHRRDRTGRPRTRWVAAVSQVHVSRAVARRGVRRGRPARDRHRGAHAHRVHGSAELRGMCRGAGAHARRCDLGVDRSGTSGIATSPSGSAGSTSTRSSASGSRTWDGCSSAGGLASCRGRSWSAVPGCPVHAPSSRCAGPCPRTLPRRRSSPAMPRRSCTRPAAPARRSPRCTSTVTCATCTGSPSARGGSTTRPAYRSTCRCFLRSSRWACPPAARS